MIAMSRPERREVRHCGRLLLLLTLLTGCATHDLQPAPIHHWTQLGADGSIHLRAIVAAGRECPTAIVDGSSRPLRPRAQANTRSAAVGTDNPAFDPEFAVTSCELALPASARQASIDRQTLAMPRPDIRRMVVIGDTGCRIKVPASAPGDPIQDCASPADWPWQRIALAAARTQPDLVIHLGDFHYREYCDNAALCSSIRDKGVVIGYDWAGWNADFFTPAKPLLAAAPWVMVRGNHENCDRGGEGWMRFLSPVPYEACDDQRHKTDSRSLLANNRTANAYRIDLDGGPSLVVADNAAHEDYRTATATPLDVEVFQRTLHVLTAPPARTDGAPVWLLVHRPIWYDLLDATAAPNALQTVLAGKLPANVEFVFAGHEHAFQTVNFSPTADLANYPSGRPAQVLVGTGGTQLEVFDPQSPLYEGKVGMGGMERARPDGRLYDGVAAGSGVVINRYGFLLLERDDQGWAASLLDPDGKAISHCRLHGERKEIACSFPSP